MSGLRTCIQSGIVSDLARIGITVPNDLLDRFDDLISAKEYPSRSEAFRDLIRDALVDRDVAGSEGDVVGTLTLVYDHHARQLNDRLTGMQHEHHSQIISTVHIHLDHHNCLEVIILRGRGSIVQKIADRLIAVKGVRHGRLTITKAEV
jgi:CopG family nickel-responsive transcriptional regulator